MTAYSLQATKGLRWVHTILMLGQKPLENIKSNLLLEEEPASKINPSSKLGQATQGFSRQVLKISQDEDFSLSEQPIPAFDHSLGWEVYLWWHRIFLAVALVGAQALLHLSLTSPWVVQVPFQLSLVQAKKSLSALSAAIQPLNHLVFPSWTCSSLAISLLYCKPQIWAQPWAPLILCSHRAGGALPQDKNPETQEKPSFSQVIIPDYRCS